MKENKYDDPAFFKQYSAMPRSVAGLEAAGEWHAFRRMFPELRSARLLDLGCGFGWHCRYAIEQGAESAVGVDISEKMLAEARKKTESSKITYLLSPIEDIDFPEESFDIVISSLAFHYLQSFSNIVDKVRHCLPGGGAFVFSVEHPVFTAFGTEDWHYSQDGRKIHWPVDHYFEEGERQTGFLGETVLKYHKTVTTYVQTLLHNGFSLIDLVEPQPDPKLLDSVPGFRDELRRPMMLLLSARKK